MAYQQTTATSVEDLINKLATFASGLGWTIDRNTIATGNRTLSISRAGSDYIHIFNSDTSNINLRASTGINTGLGPTLQPGVSAAQAVSNCGAGPFATVFLFGEAGAAPYVHCVFDTGNAIFRHIHFGMIEKIGSWTGGTFFDATNVNTVSNFNDRPTLNWHHVSFSQQDNNNGTEGGIRIDFDGNTSYFAPITNEGSFTTRVVHGGVSGDGSSNGGRDLQGFYLSSVNSWSGVTPLRRIKLRAERGSGFWSEIGYVPGMRLVNIARWAVGDEFSIGPDTWKVFPWWRQGFRPSGDTTSAYSGNYGFAYLKTL
jgi:hypothetical protein